MFKKIVQQGRNHFDARSVLSVREHGKLARTPLTDFFNIPLFDFFGDRFKVGQKVTGRNHTNDRSCIRYG